MKLTVKLVEQLRKKKGRYADGQGLYLQVMNPPHNASWLFRYERDGKERWLGLGPLHTFSLAEARERARQARQTLYDGVDPLEAKRAARAQKAIEAAKTLTFAEAAEAYFAAHEKQWSDKHRTQFVSSLETYANPVLGKLPVSAIDTGLVLRAIEPIWAAKTETANRVRGRIEMVLDWSTVRGFRSGDNPARWRGHLSEVLPARQKAENFAAMAYAQVPAFMAELRSQEGLAARALEFAILTAARTGEVLNARWEEIDFKEKAWTVPASRMKGGKAHRVPLTGRAIELLKGLPREEGNPHLFPGARRGAAAGPLTMIRELKRLGREKLTVHGFRSAFRDWAAETTHYPNHVVEQALAHQIGNAVEKAYRRGDLIEKRRALMADWAAYCAGETTGKVVPLRRAK